MKNYKVHLIRTGSTTANEQGIYCGGGTDIGLSPYGKSRLAELLGEGIYPYAEEIYASPLLRAAETAEILFPNQGITVLPELKEADFGPFEGRSFEELKNDPVYQKWVSPTSKFTPQGVEPSEQFFNRCIEGFVKIVTHMTEAGVYSAAVITHASVIGNILAGVCLPKRPPYDWLCDPGCGFTAETNAMLWMRGGVCEVTGMLPFEEAETPSSEDEPYC